MRTRLSLHRLVVAVAFLLVLAVFGGQTVADAPDTIPDPPWHVNCEGAPTFYDEIYVYVWQEDGATRAQVYRATAPTGGYSYIGQTSLDVGFFFQYIDSDVDAGQPYYYKAKSCNGDGCSALSSHYSGCVVATYDPPSNVQASDGTYSDKVRVTFTDYSGPTKYGIHRATSSGGAYTFVGWDWDGDYDDTTADPGRQYYYKVNACTGSENCGALSPYNGGHRKIAPPSYIQASDGNWNGYVPVNWPDVDLATYYLLYRGTSTAGYDSGWTKTLYTSSYEDHTVVGTTHYYYWVKAGNGLSESGFRGPDEGWAGEPPPVPTNVQASDGSTYFVRVTWNASTGAEHYDVYRSATSSSSGYILVGDNVTGTQWDDFSAVVDQTYWYKMTACKWLGCSDYSAPDSGYRAGAPDPPTNLYATDGVYADRVGLVWNPSSGATGYQVYRHTSNDSGAATQIEDYTASTNYSDYGGVAGQVYYYWVTASNAAGWSGYSDPNTGYRESLPSATPTRTPTPTSTATPTNTPRPGPTDEPTNTPRPSATGEPTDTPRPTRDATPTNTPRPGPTDEPTTTPRPTEGATPTITPRPTEQATPTRTPRPIMTPTPTGTPGPSPTPTLTPAWLANPTGNILLPLLRRP